MQIISQPGQDKALVRRKRETIIIIVTLFLVAGLTFWESQVLDFPGDLSQGAFILIFALINVNIILLLLLIFLIFRNLVKLILENKRGVWGAKLRTKLSVAFIILSLAPCVLLFYAAFQFVSTSIDYWFSAQVENALQEGLEISEDYNQQLSEGTAHFARLISSELAQKRLNLTRPGLDLNRLAESRRAQYDLTAVQIISPDLSELTLATQSGIHPAHLSGLPRDLLARAMTSEQIITHLQASASGDYAVAVQAVMDNGKALGAVAAYRLLPNGAMAKVQGVRQGLEGYRQLKALKEPIETHQYITLVIVALLIIFAATWFGFYLAKTITVPLNMVAQATQRVAGGDYNVYIDQEGPDEIGGLVNAFNRMTADLNTSKARLDEAQTQMRRTNLELEQRRRYLDIVLSNVAAGVVAVDADGLITTFNPSAERLLKVQAAGIVRRHWREILSGEALELMEQLTKQQAGGVAGWRGVIDRQVRLNVMGEPLALMLHLASMRDDQGNALGQVLVFEDLTELEKAQRMSAWREVARRIAHEVKNPLTPIKLSAQRLARRYAERLADDAEVFNECTSTIINQVDDIRQLVNEFSTFARLPSVRLSTSDITQIAQEAVAMFRTAHAEIDFELDMEPDMPSFDLDREQISRVFINLLDNAVAAVKETEPPYQVGIHLSYDEILRIARIEFEDSGPGVPPEHRLRLFEPYFSTKHGGTGLGLAIVSTIIADHNGYIRVHDNQPRGTRIIIELPVRAPRPIIKVKAQETL